MMSFLIIHLLLSINANAQTTADLPATQPTSEFGVTTFSIDSTHDFHPECNDVSIGLTAPTLPGQPWYAVSSFDHWGGVGVAFTNAWIDTTTNDIIYESPLSDLVWKSWSITSAGDYSKPFMRVSGTDHCYVNAQIAYLINFNDRTQWKRIGIRANAGASGAHNFIPTDFDFASNAGDVVTANSATCSPTPIDPCDPQCPNTCDPTLSPTVPTLNPTKTPSLSPSKGPTRNPTDFPTTDPTIAPTNDPTIDPTFDPTSDPTFDPTVDPTIDPTVDPTIDPTNDPTNDPTIDPTVDPTSIQRLIPPSIQRSIQPTTQQMILQLILPSIQRLIQPTTQRVILLSIQRVILLTVQNQMISMIRKIPPTTLK
eukprot:566601_1